MKPKQARFVAAYIKTGLKDVTAAALAAGYKGKHVRKTGYRVLHRADIQAEIGRALMDQEKRILFNRDQVLAELYRIGTVDIGQAFDEAGHLKAMADMPEALRSAITAVEIKAIYESKDGTRKRVGDLVKVKFTDKREALEAVGRHFKMLPGKEAPEPAQ